MNAAVGGLFVDATVGLGGHAAAILQSSPEARVIGIDRDASSLEQAARRLAPFGARVELIHADFRNLAPLLAGRGINGISGILADLGVSSYQLTSPERGFSFREDGPLDMRMDASRGLTAAGLIEDAPAEELAGIFYEYGEERNSRRIARAIVTARRRKPIRTTLELAAVVARASGGARGRIHPATRVFQALRIAVNHELEGLEGFVADAAGLLKVGGRFAVLTFHSLEDRIMKKQMRWLSSRCSCSKSLPQCTCGRPNVFRLLTKRPIRPGPSEVRTNPRSRSAKLRAAVKI